MTWLSFVDTRIRRGGSSPTILATGGYRPWRRTPLEFGALASYAVAERDGAAGYLVRRSDEGVAEQRLDTRRLR